MKKNVLKKYLLMFALFLGTTVGFSQLVYNGDLNIISQQQITDFNNEGWIEVRGNINVVGSPYSDQSDPPIDITFPNLTIVSDIVISCETAEVINFPELEEVDGLIYNDVSNRNHKPPYGKRFCKGHPSPHANKKLFERIYEDLKK